MPEPLRFDDSLHHNPPKNFHQREGSEDYPNPNIIDKKGYRYTDGYQNGDDNLPMYGLNTSVSLYLKTEYKEPGILGGKKIDKQQSYLSFTCHTTRDGYERMPEDLLQATLGESIDPKKVEVAGEVARAMARKLRAAGFTCETDSTSLVVRFEGNSPNLKQQCEDIYARIAEVSREYEAGNKPLGDITPSPKEFRVNPKRMAQRDPLEAAQKPAESWEKRTTAPTDMADQIVKLSEKYFPGATSHQRELFADEVKTLLDRGLGK